MSVRSFLEPSALERGMDAVKAVESRTSAELVLAVRPSSASYRGTDLGFGAVAALLALGFLWLSPIVFAPALMSLDVALIFALASVASSSLPALRRLLAGRPTLRAHAERHARATFYEQGVLRTTARTGVLVFVSLFEREVVLVPDIGIDPATLGEPYRAAERALRTAVARLDFDAFLAAVATLGRVLESALPRAADDVNELPDEVA